MCGIAGYVVHENSGNSNETLIKMTHGLTNRGPDDKGYFWLPRVVSGSRRLSIIDLSSSGRAPICNETRTVALVQNYNS
ncbi:MAG: hypothetical protein KatS3mg087_2134 [Patescibacteria group bacterium]|nr:MAG: hypothetical protein KatS3mg055_0864 [Chloroflexus sp.]GIW61068.1 MAG: hypothetical protein KatS3mg087_2134 [Patescibacteria group bacterium]